MSCVPKKQQVDKEMEESSIPSFIKDEKNKKIIELLNKNASNISNDSLIKIIRQLDFWLQEKQNLSESDSLELTQKLIDVTTWRKNNDITCPKVRFGKTELQMPIITCGSMRFQHTWMPDFVPVIGPSKKKVLQSPSQDNLTEVVRQCLKRGINHFETARMYGTSEIQLSQALQTLISQGEIKRSDFILQTKLPVVEDTKSFRKYFNQSWDVFEPLGHIDLLSFWCVSKPEHAGWALSDEKDSSMSMALQWKKEGKIKHIGFSTHGSTEVIMEMIESNKFEYVNLHYHFFGSYHAEGTVDGNGGHGNLACVKRALELDMGVFNISPVDKGGQLYQPSATVARLIGPKLSPIAFAALHSWETANMHTISVGLARPEDLDEVLDAAMLFNKEEMKPLLRAAEERLVNHSKQTLGKEWHEKSLLNLPSCFDESSAGLALGHILWCSNMIHAYGMYDCAHARYFMLEKTKWNYKKSFEDNIKAMQGGNPGRSYDESWDLTSALSNHFDPTTALEKIKEVHKLLSSKSKKSITSEERKEKGWEEAYDLRPWNEYPDTGVIMCNPLWVLVQNNFIGKWYYSGGGPTATSIETGNKLRNIVQDLPSCPV